MVGRAQHISTLGEETGIRAGVFPLSDEASTLERLGDVQNPDSLAWSDAVERCRGRFFPGFVSYFCIEDSVPAPLRDGLRAAMHAAQLLDPQSCLSVSPTSSCSWGGEVDESKLAR